MPHQPVETMGSESPRQSHGLDPVAQSQGPRSPAAPEASTALVHELVHDQAKGHPDAEAVVSWDGSLSYAELDSASARLAGHLSSAAVGVRAETVVPLVFEKSRWAIVSMLAVLKAGGAFMPLDVSQPGPRIRTIIAEAQGASAGGVVVALCSAESHGLCSMLSPPDVEVFAVTEEGIAALPSSRVEATAVVAVGLFDAAYVMATSGSTGTPKLVVTEHSQLASFVSHLTGALGFSAQTRALQFASYAFDPIIGDIFLTLAAGGTVCIPSEQQRINDIVGAMNEFGVNLAKLTPSLVGSLAADLTPASVPTLKTLVMGGETAPVSVIQRWVRKGEDSGVDLRLIYGSTECTISCVVQIADAEAASALVPGEIGRPVGSRAWVCARDGDSYQGGQDASSTGAISLRPVADGEIGELVVEGPLVARGYMNNPLQTKAKFVNTPGGDEEEARPHRRYRTGDLVRRLPDDRLVYVGRTDNQIKIRAQRLELEEVERHVRLCLSDTTVFPDLRVRDVLVDAVVPCGGDAATEKQLVALLSLEDGSTDFGSLDCGDGRDGDGAATVRVSPSSAHNFARAVAQLEHSMRAAVPSYMVPSLWVPIDEMPHTLSRKRDRQRLRRAIESLPSNWLATFSTHGDLQDAGAKMTPVASLTYQEAVLGRFWAELLRLKSNAVQPADNFFHLGGNSLQVMRLISMARREGMVLVADDVFANPVLRDMALKLSSSSMSKESGSEDDPAPFALLHPDHRDTIRRETAEQCLVSLDDVEDIYPLYSMQEFYVFGYPESGQDPAGPWDWQQQIVFELPEKKQAQEGGLAGLDVALFKSVWSEAVSRHVQLRTRVVRTSKGVFQAVMRREAAPRWRNIVILDGVADLEAYVRRDREDVMSFGDELLRLAMLTTTPGPGSPGGGTRGSSSSRDRYFVLTMQHLIYDAYSRDNLFRELEAAYRSRRLDPSLSSRNISNHHVGPPPPRMSSFVRYVNGADRELGNAFWTSYLQGAQTKPLLSAPIGSPVAELKTKEWTTPKPSPPAPQASASTSAERVGLANNYTVATVIEVSVALALARILRCADVLFYSDRAGRNLPVPGVQDLMAPATLFLPLRVHVGNPSQPVRHLLEAHQQQNTAMMPFEYLGFTELRRMPPLRGVLAHALEININPYTPIEELGKAWGMNVVDEHERWGDPFAVSVSVGEEEVRWGVYFDEAFVSEDVVSALVGHIREVFGVLSAANLEPDLVVGDLLGPEVAPAK